MVGTLWLLDIAIASVSALLLLGILAVHLKSWKDLRGRILIGASTFVFLLMIANFTVNIAYKSGVGFYLTNGSGFALYFRSTDTPNSGTTTCKSSGCEKAWPAFYTSTLKLPPGLNASNFSTITPYNSTKIVTYDGY